MAHPSKRKGDVAELEVARLLADLTGWPITRKLGAGRAEDTGDLYGVPDTTVQVKNYPSDLVRSIRDGLADLRQQQANAGTTFGVALIRRRGGRWFAAMDIDQLATLLREATEPAREAHPREDPRVQTPGHGYPDRQSPTPTPGPPSPAPGHPGSEDGGAEGEGHPHP